MHKGRLLPLILMMFVSTSVFAQQAIIELEDDVLPIAPTRFDDAVEPPKDNFSSVSKGDMWEKFERGELDEKAFVKLQEQYQMAASQSKDPVVKRKIAADLKEKKVAQARVKKETVAAKLAEAKKKKKREDATAFDREVDMMAKDKQVAEVKEKSKAKVATKAPANTRAPASVKKTKKTKK